jgi:hypothetical protein
MDKTHADYCWIEHYNKSSFFRFSAVEVCPLDEICPTVESSDVPRLVAELVLLS